MASHIFSDTSATLAFEQFIKPAESSPTWRTIHHRDGSSATTYVIEVRQAVENFPDQWAYEPWKKQRKS